MNRDEKQFHSLLNILAEQCNYQLSVPTIAMYDQALSKFGYAKANTALEVIFNTRRGGDRFPSVADILEKMGVIVSDRALAVDCANTIITAFRAWRMDYYDREDFQQQYIGKVGLLQWTVLERMGGYRHGYKEWSDAADMGVFRAQLRESALAVIELTRAGHIDHDGLLEATQRKQIEGKDGR